MNSEASAGSDELSPAGREWAVGCLAGSARFGARGRDGDQDRLREPVASSGDGQLDVLVIGGGVVGAGVALDAVSRGMRVAVVEAEDWAAGTSSKASKLIHGGLRYLEMLDFGLVREALRERGLLLETLAPHLVHPVPFLYPLTHRVWERPYVGAGVLLYDTMGRTSGASTGVPHHRHLSKRRALAQAPGLRPDTLTGAIQYWDGQVDDARYTLALIRTAARYGAVCASRLRATELLRYQGRVRGAVLRDAERATSFEVHARAVVNATGVWTEESAGEAARRAVRIRASKGVHLMVRGDAIDSRTGLIVRTEKSVLLVIPWHGHWLVGTTDTPWEQDGEEPVPTSGDVRYLLDHLNEVLVHPVGEADVEATFAGLRPLVDTGADETTKMSREHAVVSPEPGLTVIVGGKFTTYRVMAEDTVNRVVEGLAGPPVPASVTRRTPLLGAEGFFALTNQRARLAERWSVAPAVVDHLLRRYGSLLEEVLAPSRGRPELLGPLPGAETYLKAEVVYAVTDEGALHLDDVLARRTRIAIEVPDAGLAAAEPVSRLMGSALGWDEQRRLAEVATYRAWVAGQEAARRSPDDATALAAERAAEAEG